jgi:hypothetical protein
MFAVMRALETAVHLQPDFAIAHSNLGNASADLHQPATAAQHYEPAIRLISVTPTRTTTTDCSCPSNKGLRRPPLNSRPRRGSIRKIRKLKTTWNMSASNDSRHLESVPGLSRRGDV